MTDNGGIKKIDGNRLNEELYKIKNKIKNAENTLKSCVSEFQKIIDDESIRSKCAFCDNNAIKRKNLEIIFDGNGYTLIRECDVCEECADKLLSKKTRLS